ncbi:MAG: permease [Candidatus Omnitrophica bacterium]|nr:permease [Candidatus Omnitrophota bacterium]
MLQLIVDWLTYSLFKLSPQAKLAQAVNFFIYDSVKILLLLFILISAIGFLRSYLPADKIKQWLAGKKIFPHFLASIFGAITPFCSCSSIPIFISFLEAGVPLGVTFSFLISSPLINEYLVVLMLGFFGFKITFFYVLSGIIIGVVSGIILGKMKLERYLVKDLISQNNQDCFEKDSKGFKGRILFGVKEASTIIKKLWFWVLIGVGLGALIHNFVPQELVRNLISKTGFFSVPLATIIGVPMYGSCAAIVPIAVALFQKGFPLGTALAFMMAVAALSLPEAVMLRRAMQLKLIAIFFMVTTVAIIFTGYLFNFLQKILL